MQSLPISSIDIGSRVRDADPADIDIIAASMASEGLLQPIIVRDIGKGRVRLVAGLHRLMAAKKLGWSEIACIPMPASGDEEIDDCAEAIVECDENLNRAGLEEGMRALFVDRRTLATTTRSSLLRAREAAKREKEGRELAAKAKTKAEKKAANNIVTNAVEARKEHEKRAATWQKATTMADSQVSAGKGTLDVVADQTGVSKRVVKADLELVREFGPEVLALASKQALKTDNGRIRYSARGELASLKRLKREYPQDYERVIQSWRESVAKGNGTGKRPSQALADIAIREAEDKKAESRKTLEGALEAMVEAMSRAKAEIVKARTAAQTLSTALNLKTLPNDVRIAFDKCESVRSVLVQHRQALKAQKMEASQ